MYLSYFNAIKKLHSFKINPFWHSLATEAHMREQRAQSGTGTKRKTAEG